MAEKSNQPKSKKSKQSIRQILAPVHTWTGLLLGWLLFLIFLMGSLSYFQKEISIWTMPHVFAAVGKSDDKMLAKAGEYAQKNYPNAEKIIVEAGNDRQALRMDIVHQDGWANRTQLVANRAGGFDRVDNHSDGGDFFYRLHFDLHYLPVVWARYLVGLAAMMMFIALVTGVIIHKKIISDFFTFRGKKGQRSWLDAHNALSVLPLPFHLMITFTGIISLVDMYLPLGVKVAQLPDDLRRPYYALDWWAEPPKEPSLVPPPKILPLIELSKQQWGISSDYAVSTLSILFPNTPQMEISVEHLPDKQFSYLGAFWVYDQTGQLIRQNPNLPSGVVANQAIIGMHTGHTVDYWLRFVFFALGLSGTAMIATGLVLWTVKRRVQLKNQTPNLGFRVVESLNIGVIMGVPLAVAVFFLANRLLPDGMVGRSTHEVTAFFVAWALSMVLAVILPKRWAWLVLSFGTALAYGSLPWVNALTTQRGLVSSLLAKDYLFVLADGLFVLVGVLFWHIGRRIKNHQAPVKPQKTTKKSVLSVQEVI